MNAEQFWASVDKNGPVAPRLKSRCWLWMGGRAQRIFGDDYGIVSWRGRQQSAHRVAWEITHGIPVPAALRACHACDNPPCVNPAHIWIGTSQHNSIDRVLKGRMGRVRDWGPFQDGRYDYAKDAA